MDYLHQLVKSLFSTSIKHISVDDDQKDAAWQLTTFIEGMGLVSKNSPERGGIPTPQTSIARLFVLFIKNPSGEFTLKELSEELGVDRHTISNQIRKLTGRTLVTVTEKKVPHTVRVMASNKEGGGKKDVTRPYSIRVYSLTGGSLDEAMKSHNTAARDALGALLMQSKLITPLLSDGA